MELLKGKGAKMNVPNRFLTYDLSTEDHDGIDEALLDKKPVTEVFYETPKKIISNIKSPDIGHVASVNPYQGCEHGCAYCYARNSHEYWGFSAGLDFETKIIVKQDAPSLLEREFLKRSYRPKVIMLSGNTDCYQPLEKKLKITRNLLKMFLKYQHPVGIITKNALVTRDLDLLKELSETNLVQVIFSITTLDEKLRGVLEPRTASAIKKLEAMELLSKNNVPVGVMNAPIIPGLNDHEIPKVLSAAANAGANFAGYTVVRLNGQIATIFKDWLTKTYPNKVDKIWNQVSSLHDGEVNDHTFGRRMKGEGVEADIIKNLFEVSRKKYFTQTKPPELSTTYFRRMGNYQLF